MKLLRTLAWLALPLAAGCKSAPPPAEGANVVVITLDTVRADHLGAYGYDEARTPTLDRLAGEGALFETAIAVAPVTMPTHASLFTGLYPMRHGVRNNGSFVLGGEVETLAERLGAEGYDTAAVVSALVVDSKFGLDQGFRVYDDDLAAGGDQKMFMFKEVPADVTVDKAIELVSGDLQEPFFLWVHLFDAHADYEPPPPWDVVFREQPYDGEIAFVDTQLDRLFGALRDEGLHERTLTMVTADHGDSLGEHGEYTHGIFIYRSTTHVPWIVSGPGIAAQRHPGVVSQVDLAPTVTDLVGVERLEGDGISLYDTLVHGEAVPARDGVYVESINPRLHFGWHELRAVDGGDRKFIEAPRPELYDLQADPDEQQNLWEKQGDGGALARAVDRFSEGDDLGELDGSALDRETAEMLEALGYTAEVTPAAEGKLPDPKDVAHRWVDLQKCQAMIRHGLPSDAEACLRGVLEEQPRNWTARMSLAAVYRSLGRPAEGLPVLEKALAMDPDHVKALMSLSSLHQALGHTEQAIDALEKAAEAAPADPEPRTSLGDLYQALGDGERAIDAYGEALERDEVHVPAYVGLANTFHRAGQSDRALRYLETATELEPTNHAAWYNLGVVRDAQGKLSGAEEAYRRASELDPSHAMTWNNLGSLLKRQERRVEAERMFRQALEHDPDSVEARYNLATLLLDDRPEVAVGLLRAVVADAPDLLPARHNLAVALQRVERDAEALEQYAWIAEHAPDQPGPHLAMAGIEAERGHRSAARAHLRKALDIGGDQVRERIASDPVLSGLGG